MVGYEDLPRSDAWRSTRDDAESNEWRREDRDELRRRGTFRGSDSAREEAERRRARERDEGDYGSRESPSDRGFRREHDAERGGYDESGRWSLGRGPEIGSYGRGRGEYEYEARDDRGWTRGGEPYGSYDRGARGSSYGGGYGSGAGGYGGATQDGSYRGGYLGERPREDYRGRGPKGYRRSDERILEDLNECLTQDSAIDATAIECACKDGEITLSGTVRTREEKRRAEDVAERCSGVKEVQNNLRVKRESGDDVSASVARSFDSSRYLAGQQGPSSPASQAFGGLTPSSSTSGATGKLK